MQEVDGRSPMLQRGLPPGELSVRESVRGSRPYRLQVAEDLLLLAERVAGGEAAVTPRDAAGLAAAFSWRHTGNSSSSS